MTFNLILSAKVYSIYKFEKDFVLPDWIYLSEFCSVTRTNEELSLVIEQTDQITDFVASSNDWRILKIEGPLEFSMIGVIADISAILKEAKVSVFIISTYNTDYILVKDDDLNASLVSLKNNGYKIRKE